MYHSCIYPACGIVCEICCNLVLMCTQFVCLSVNQSVGVYCVCVCVCVSLCVCLWCLCKCLCVCVWLWTVFSLKFILITWLDSLGCTPSNLDFQNDITSYSRSLQLKVGSVPQMQLVSTRQGWIHTAIIMALSVWSAHKRTGIAQYDCIYTSCMFVNLVIMANTSTSGYKTLPLG